jgi:predicted TIM-barrel fold metal-dependent hydrolase
VQTLFCILMMDMIIGIEGKPNNTIEDQMNQLAMIRDKNPVQILPFFAVDPRRTNAIELFAKAFDPEGPYRFFGFKVYPSLGYLPSHPNLMQIYAICEEKRIPVTTHCSSATVHSSYRKIRDIKGVHFNNQGEETDGPFARTFRNKNAYAMFFNHPRNWDPVLMSFPNLKLNLAHFGGDRQWKDFLAGKTDTWVARIISMMYSYKQLYADFAYNLYNDGYALKLKQLVADNALIGSRVLFGSDYYMVVTEGHYRNIYASFRSRMGDQLMHQLSVENPSRFLFG